MEIDWVKRKAMGEQYAENGQEDIWRSLCTALGSAIDSYRAYYGGAARGEDANNHHYRISVNSKPPYQDAVIDVTFAPPEVRVVCTMGQCKMSTFILNPSKDKPFRNHDREQFTVDQVSEKILWGIFFPTERRGVPAHTVSPCN